MAKYKYGAKTNWSHFETYKAQIFSEGNKPDNFVKPADIKKVAVNNDEAEDQFDMDTNADDNAIDNESPVKPDPNSDYDPAKDVGVRKYRRRMSKEKHVKKISKIIKGGIGHDPRVHNTMKIPGSKSMDEELYNDAIDEKAFVKATIREYESDLDKAYKRDNNGDNKVDDDDITPGMRRMSRYM